MASLWNKKWIIQQIQCALAHNLPLIGVKITIWREVERGGCEGGAEGRVTYLDIIWHGRCNSIS